MGRLWHRASRRSVDRVAAMQMAAGKREPLLAGTRARPCNRPFVISYLGHVPRTDNRGPEDFQSRCERLNDQSKIPGAICASDCSSSVPGTKGIGPKGPEPFFLPKMDAMGLLRGVAGKFRGQSRRANNQGCCLVSESRSRMLIRLLPLFDVRANGVL